MSQPSNLGHSTRCGKLMVGSGPDTYDPCCELAEGHDGACRSTAAIDQHRLPFCECCSTEPGTETGHDVEADEYLPLCPTCLASLAVPVQEHRLGDDAR